MSKTELSIYIKEKRKGVEPSATVFFHKNEKTLLISYQNFIHYENGVRQAPVLYLKKLAPLIAADFRTLCNLWVRASMPDEESKSFFTGVPGLSANMVARSKAHEVYRFSRSDIKYLLAQQKLFMVAAFMGAYQDSKPISLNELMLFSELSKAETLKLISTLDELGVVSEEGKGLYKSKYKDFEIPRDDEAFKEIRNNNFRNISEKVLKNFTTEKRNRGEAQRYTFTTRLTAENQRIIQSKLSELESLFDTIVDDGDRLGSVCVAFSDYFVREGKKR